MRIIRKETKAVSPQGKELHEQDATTILGVLLSSCLLKEGRSVMRFTRDEQFRGFRVEPSWEVDQDGTMTVTLNRREGF